MALQSQNLVMLGLGVEGDSPPNEIQARLVDGIHLRWNMARGLGFPWYGFYLFRRPHRGGTRTKCLKNYIQDHHSSLLPGTLPNRELNTLVGLITSDQNLKLTNEFPSPPDELIEFDLSGRGFLLFSRFPDAPLHKVEMQIGFHSNASIQVTAKLWDVPVVQITVTGAGRQVLDVTLESDAITEVEIGPGPAGLIDFCPISVLQDATQDWQRIESGLPYPLPLPITHPDYPAGRATSESFSGSRSLARSRILYGSPDQFTSPTGSPYTTESVHVENGSPIVVGSGTNWDESLIGKSFQATGDATAYTVLNVIANNKLVLSRNYTGTDGDKGYAISDDAFGQLYDYLVHLVAGGPVAGGMPSRSLPAPIYSDRWISVTHDSPTVTGIGTHWGSEFAGLALSVSERVGGSLRELVYRISSVDSATQLTLERNYLGSTDPDKPYKIISALQPTGEPGVAPVRMPDQRPLDLVLLGAVNPAVAQMLGLSWVDQTALEGVAYDYIILGDDTGILHETDVDDIPAWLTRPANFNSIQAWIVFNKRKEPMAPLAAPQNPKVYALPSVNFPGNDSSEGSNNAALNWQINSTALGALLPGSAVMYHVWRAYLGDGEAPTTPDGHTLITGNRPILIGTPRLGARALPPPPPDWPPASIPLRFVDSGLADGWYSYQVSGIDIFGRHSPNSPSASWYQWDPVPDPRPWYYVDPPGHTLIHSSAVLLLDKMPPPPPTAIEAFALDPADPLVLRDTAYNIWRGANPGVVGLRVRWQWTEAHQQLAPDLREFRIYYQPGRTNALLGRTRSVSVLNLSESLVETDIPNTHAANAYAGATLLIGPSAFKIVASGAESPLRLRVRNLASPIYAVGTISIQSGSSRLKGANTNWRADLVGMPLQVEEESAVYTIRSVDAPTQITLDPVYAGSSRDGVEYGIYRIPRANAPCTVVIPPPHTAGRVSATQSNPVINRTGTEWNAQLINQILKFAGESSEYRIIDVDADATPQRITLDRGYEGSTGTDKAYAIRHPLLTDFGDAANWQHRIFVVGYEENFTELLRQARDRSGNILQGDTATAAGNVITLEEDPDLSGLVLEGDPLFKPHIFLENDTNRPNKIYRIQVVDNRLNRVTVDGMPSLVGGRPRWKIGFPVRQYEVFLPAPSDSLSPSLADPILYAQIGVSAADDKNHSQDPDPNLSNPPPPPWAGGPWGGRPGNEGRVGAPAQIFMVLRQRPDPPVLPVYDSDKVYATPADYHSHSFYTYRWQPQAYLKAHIFRALDDAVFKIDSLIRTTRIALDPDNPQHSAFFPNDPPTRWTPAAKRAAAAQLNAITSLASYDLLSQDAREVLKNLPGNEGFAGGRDFNERDWLIRRVRGGLIASDTGHFPSDWTEEAKRDTVARELNALILSGQGARVSGNFVTLDGTADLSRVQRNRDTIWLASATRLSSPSKAYRIVAVQAAARRLRLDEAPNVPGGTSIWVISLNRTLSNDALRVLAGLPGNERAFAQVTLQPLDPDDSTNADRRGPDNPDTYAPDLNLRAYVDTLDGRSTNRYFYRAAYVDGAHNRSFLSLSSPPVYLPNVVPLRAPVITKVLGGDRQITLKWASNREPDLKEYRVYRADSEEKARDLRLMTRVHRRVVPAGDPLARPAEVSWINRDLPGLVTFYYRVVAVDEAGNVSQASKMALARAYDQTPPEPPSLELAFNSTLPSVTLSWHSGPLVRYMVQRRSRNSNIWFRISDWLPYGTASYQDLSVQRGGTYIYRLRAQSSAGNLNANYIEQLIAIPE